MDHIVKFSSSFADLDPGLTGCCRTRSARRELQLYCYMQNRRRSRAGKRALLLLLGKEEDGQELLL